MTSAISSLSGISGIGGVDALSKVNGLSGLDAVGDDTGTDATSGTSGDFAGMLSKGLESVQASQTKSDNLAVQAADGTLQDPAQYTMAANQAQLGLDLTLAVRNKAVDAFQEIMRMQA